jgi:hypothetical protein
MHVLTRDIFSYTLQFFDTSVWNLYFFIFVVEINQPDKCLVDS